MLIIVSIWALGILVGKSLRTKFNLTFKYKKDILEKNFEKQVQYIYVQHFYQMEAIHNV